MSTGAPAGSKIWNLSIETLDRVLWFSTSSSAYIYLLVCGDSRLSTLLRRSLNSSIDLKDERVYSTSRWPSLLPTYGHLRHISINRGEYMLSYPWMLARALRQLPQGLLSLKITSTEADLSLWSQRPPPDVTIDVGDAVPWKDMFPSLETLLLANGPHWDEGDLLQLPSSLLSLHFKRKSPHGQTLDASCFIKDFSHLPRGLTSLNLPTGDFELKDEIFASLPPNMTSLLGFGNVTSTLCSDRDALHLIMRQLPKTLTESLCYYKDLTSSVVALMPPSLTVFHSSSTDLPSDALLPSKLTSLTTHIHWDESLLPLIPATVTLLDCSSIAWDELFTTYQAEISELREMASKFDFAGRLPQGRVHHPDYLALTASLAVKKPLVFPRGLKTLCVQRDLPQKAAYLLPSSVTSTTALDKLLEKRWTAKYSLLLPKLREVHHHVHSGKGDSFEAISFLTSLEGSLVESISLPMRVSLGEGGISRFPRNLRKVKFDQVVLLASELRFLPAYLEEFAVYAVTMDHGVDSMEYGAHNILDQFPKSLKALSLSQFHNPDAGPISRFDGPDYDYEGWAFAPVVLTDECFRFLPPHLTSLAIWDQMVPITSLNWICSLPLTNLRIMFDKFDTDWWCLLPETITSLDMEASDCSILNSDFYKLPPYLDHVAYHMSSLARIFGQDIRDKRKMPQSTPDHRVIEKLYGR